MCEGAFARWWRILWMILEKAACNILVGHPFVLADLVREKEKKRERERNLKCDMCAWTENYVRLASRYRCHVRASDIYVCAK